MEERREVRVQTRDEREEGGEGYRRGMEERRQVKEQMRDGREEGGKGTDEGWKSPLNPLQ
jgi:hypothetical protein